MKKRKPPIILAIVLLAFVAIAAAFNNGGDPFAFLKRSKFEDAHQNEGNGPLDKPRMTADKMEILTSMKKSRPGSLDAGENFVPNGTPLLVWRKYKPSAPRPTDSDTSMQWYTKEYRGTKK